MNEITGRNDPSPDPDIILDRLKTSYAEQLQRMEDLLASYGRIPTQEVEVRGRKVNAVKNEADKGKTAVLVKMIRALISEIETIHADEKAPYKRASDAIDLFFLSKGMKGKLEPLKSNVESLISNFDAVVIAAERARLAEEQRAAEAEAARLAAEAATRADNVVTEDDLSSAIDKQDEAKQAQQAAQAAAADTATAKAVDMTRTHTDMGVTSSTTGKWTGRITNVQELDLESLRADIAFDALEKAVKSFAKRTKGTVPLRGAIIEEDFKAVIR